MAFCSLKTAILRTDSSSAPSRATSSETFTVSMLPPISQKVRWAWGEYAGVVRASQAPRRARHGIPVLYKKPRMSSMVGEGWITEAFRSRGGRRLDALARHVKRALNID